MFIVLFDDKMTKISNQASLYVNLTKVQKLELGLEGLMANINPKKLMLVF